MKQFAIIFCLIILISYSVKAENDPSALTGTTLLGALATSAFFELSYATDGNVYLLHKRTGETWKLNKTNNIWEQIYFRGSKKDKIKYFIPPGHKGEYGEIIGVPFDE
jgi:hypothetical protein